MANMVGAFFGRAADTGAVFGRLKIADAKNYRMPLKDWILTVEISYDKKTKEYFCRVDVYQNSQKVSAGVQVTCSGKNY